MPALTPSFVMQFEKNMQAITENEYARFSKHLWWQKIAKVRPSESKAERIAWLLSTATIKDAGLGGNITFEDLVTQTTEYVNKVANAGLKLSRDQLEDLDGTGLALAAKWSGDVGAYAAYWPQKQVTAFIKDGENQVAYDGAKYFDVSHPLNPFNPGAGTFANLFTSSSSGSYPGAVPIDDSVTVEDAFTNLSAVIAYIRGAIKMPNGEDPRYLSPLQLLVPPALTRRAQQLTNARFIAQSVNNTGGGGSGDVEAVIRNWGLADPIEVAEFSTDLGGDDTTWYIACEELSSSQLGALVYVDRLPFSVTYYTGQGGGTGVDAILDRARELEWHIQGRNVVGGGHPYLLFKAKAS